MSVGWVAGSVRARALARRRMGRAAARALAASPSLDAAVATLAATPYRHDVHPGLDLAEAQRGVAATLLWHLRVLAGWLPREGADTMRLLVAWFEIANVEDLLHRLAGGAGEEPFRLGALATAWPRLAGARSPAELRRVLATSRWGDPGAETPWAVTVGMRLSWAARLAAAADQAAPWAAGAAALLVARERLGAGRDLPSKARAHAGALLGPAALAAGSLPELRERLPARARWVLLGVAGLDGLWEAEARWWTRVERDGFELLRATGQGPASVLGAVAVLGVDAWRVRAALEVAARGGRHLEVVDALA
jgi:hypothetical protein